MKYSVKVVLVGEVEAGSVNEAYEMAEYEAGTLTEHEVEIAAIPLTPNEATELIQTAQDAGLRSGRSFDILREARRHDGGTAVRDVQRVGGITQSHKEH